MAYLLPLLVATLATASPLSQFVTKQALDAVPEGWSRDSAAPADHQLDLHFRLKEQNLDKLQQRALDISNPDHADFRKHMSKAEVDALTAPTKETVDSVSKWLSSHGIDAGDVNSGFLKVSMNVEQAKKLLNADYAVYKEASTGRQAVRTTSYGVPKDMHDAIAMIQPTTLFSDLGISNKNMKKVGPEAISNSAQASDATPSSCRNGVVTQCLRDNYNVNGYTATNKTTVGIAGFLEEVPSDRDLDSYLKRYDSDLPSNIHLPIVSINNGPTNPGGQGEADLDAQIVVPMTYPMKSVYHSTGGRPPINGGGENDNEPYMEWLQYVLKQDNPPQTFSISYGDDETKVPSDYADSVCTQFMKLGARGVSVLVAAGDSGAGGDSCTTFAPSFPASCPWVTTVGGTVNFGSDEASDRDGGSGFSNHFSTPDYQSAAVNGYIKALNGKFDGSYNKSGRAYPDLAASYEVYPIYHDGYRQQVVGTSAATPAVASIIALLNDYLVANGKSPLGFLNPWLYKTGKQGLRDIAKGHNNICGRNAAFPAVSGWDATTGLGVPDFAKLKQLV